MFFPNKLLQTVKRYSTFPGKSESEVEARKERKRSFIASVFMMLQCGQDEVDHQDEVETRVRGSDPAGLIGKLSFSSTATNDSGLGSIPEDLEPADARKKKNLDK